MTVRVDASELDQLAAELVALGPEVQQKIKAVVVRGALNIQRDARDLAPQSDRLRGYPHSITFDLDDDGLAADIGPDKDRAQGPLGNILEYGTSTVAPKPHLGPALDNEVPQFEEWVAKVASEGVL